MSLKPPISSSDSFDSINGIEEELADIETLLNSIVISAGIVSTVVPQTLDFNVSSANIGAEYHVTSSSPVVVTVRAQATHAIQQYASFFIARLGSGSVTLLAAGGVTINSPYGYLTLARQYSTARLLNLGSDQWLLTGDLA